MHLGTLVLSLIGVTLFERGIPLIIQNECVCAITREGALMRAPLEPFDPPAHQ